MTPAEQKAWLAGRDAAANFIHATREYPVGESYQKVWVRTRNAMADSIRALTPPAATEWTPPAACWGWAGK
jgi:hypothetical protein